MKVTLLFWILFVGIGGLMKPRVPMVESIFLDSVVGVGFLRFRYGVWL